ncbi:MAG: hypothetical protein HY815_14335 [Candidatus Riflebacteria bacterium]|nr:hypothetical protein [Candidatus Riflebacteria bacterium]
MFKTTIALSLLLAVASASMAAAKPWTVMYYVVVDERTLQHELDAVKKIPGSITDEGQVNAVLQWDTHKEACGRYVAKSGKWDQLQDKIPDNMGDGVTLFGFVDWAMKTYPAERYILFIGGHGSGFEDKWGPGSLADAARPTSWFRADLVSRAGLAEKLSVRSPRAELTTSMRTAVPQLVTNEPAKGTAYDYDDKDCLTVQEIRVVLEEIQKRHLNGKKLDILAYSSCWQMNLESIYEHQGLVDHIVGCETVSYSGSPLFYGFLPTLCKNPTAPAADLTARMIKDYIHGAESALTVAAIDTSRFRRVAMALDRMAVELLRVYRNPKNHGVDGSAFRNVLFTDSDFHKNEERFIDVSTIADNVIQKKTGFAPTAPSAPRTSRTSRPT